MKRNAGIALIGTVLLAACATQTVDIRPIKSDLAPGQLTAIARVAEGNAQLALDNVGLAQEAYRKALREDPANVDAMLGLAASYDRMGRHDLSRKQYELALAAQPKDSAIYSQFAQSLTDQGEVREAARVTAEISAISVTPETQVPVPNSVAVLPPPPMPVQPVTQVAMREASAAVPVDAGPPMSGPKLIRMSLAEVELVTRPEPRWEAKLVSRSASATTFRFEAKPASPVVLLNAARSQGLAARTRDYLALRGIRGAAIGNAPATRAQSAIQYGAIDRARAERIAAQFGFRLERLPGAGARLTVLLGRDAAIDRALRPDA
nr:LytR C-terminal domain-containing protein [uncultured Sphingomonas sp.]